MNDDTIRVTHGAALGRGPDPTLWRIPIMPDEVPFAEFIRRIRAGESQAAVELVRRYEPLIRMEVRVRLSDPRLRRSFDSMDVCQSVLGSFFLRAAAGQYALDRPTDLVKLLVVMARKKLAFQVRKERAQKRDHRRAETGAAEIDVAAVGPGPGTEAAMRDLLEAFRQRLNAEERDLADRRAQGQEWDKIAAALGGTGQARRKQLERAVARVSAQLGLEDHDD